MGAVLAGDLGGLRARVLVQITGQQPGGKGYKWAGEGWDAVGGGRRGQEGDWSDRQVRLQFGCKQKGEGYAVPAGFLGDRVIRVGGVSG